MKSSIVPMILGLLTTLCLLSEAGAREAVVLDDPTAYVPTDAITTQATKTAWRRVDASDSPSGWRLETTIETDAPDLELSLPGEGIYAIYLGVYMPDTLVSGILVRSDDDPDFAFIRGRCDGKYPAYHETFYKVCDCTGRKLIFRQPAEYRSYLTHVRLEPRTSIPTLPPATREVIGLSDAWHYNYFFASRRPDSIATLIKMHALCGMTEISNEAGRSCMIHETKVGTVYRYDAHRPRTKWLRYHAEKHRPFVTALDAADRLGIRLTARLCMNMHYRGAYRGTATSDFALNHPQFQEKKRDGKPFRDQLCFGYEPVRRERVTLFREMVQLGARSLSLDCMIYAPMGRWGDPYVQGFQQKHDVDPRTLNPNNPLWPVWLRYRASFFTQLVREIRAMLVEEGHPDAPISLRVDDRGLDSTLEKGVDLRELVKQRLIQRVILGADPPARTIDAKVIRQHLAMLKGTPVKLIAGLRAHGFPAMPGPEHHTKGNWPTAMYYCPDVAKRACNVDRMYDLGVHGVAFYESDEGCLYPGMRDFFIACRTPETIKAFVKKTRRQDQ